MKQLLNILCAAVFTAALGSPVFTASNEMPMTKTEFVEYCSSIYANHDRTSVISEDDTDRLLIQYAINTNEKERAQIENQLNDAGVFIYSEGPKNMFAPRSSSADITLNNVICSYNYDSKDWSLVAGGHWNDHTAILKDIDSLPQINCSKDIGGLDSVGIAIDRTSGILPPLKSSFGMIYDEQGTTTELKNPATSTTEKGIAFQYQDFVTAGANKSFYHMGNEFACVMRFGPDFASWNGFARGFYLHTWGKTDYFAAYSSVDTKF